MKLVACLLLLFVAAALAVRVDIDQQMRQTPSCGCHQGTSSSSPFSPMSGSSANPAALMASGVPVGPSPSLGSPIMGQPAPQQVQVMLPANFGCGCNQTPPPPEPMLPPPDNLIPTEAQPAQPEDQETQLAPPAEEAPPPPQKESCCPDSVTVIRNSNKIIRKSKTAKL